MPRVRAHDCIGAIRIALEAPADPKRALAVIERLAAYAPPSQPKEKLPVRLLCLAIQDTAALPSAPSAAK